MQALALPSSVEGERSRFAVVTRAACGTAVRAALTIMFVLCLLTSYCCFFPFFPDFPFCFSLNGCDLNPDGGKVLAKALETNGSLKELE